MTDVTDDGFEDDDLEREPPPEEAEPPGLLIDQRVAFVGKLGGVSRREASQLVRRQGGIPVEPDDSAVTLVVTGADESPLAESALLDQLLNESLRSRVTCGQAEVIAETEFWERLGMVEAERAVRRLHTPAMLAHLLGVSVSVIRRWHRRGLIIPARTVHKLPYFDFTEVATARRLAELVAAGASAEAIERRLDELSAVLPKVQRPLAQLSILIEGKQILLRQGEGLLEPGGQLRIDFDALDELSFGKSSGGADALKASDSADDNSSKPHRVRESILAFIPKSETTFPLDPQPAPEDDDLLSTAYDAEDQGELELAVDYYHAILARDGARADICFQLGEVLYRIGQVDAARERYYMAIELDEAFVEARASLGCVLAETGRLELAVAAFNGTLQLHNDYPDVHYNLARTLDDLRREDEALPHWERFLALSPDSPWAEQAKERLGIPV